MLQAGALSRRSFLATLPLLCGGPSLSRDLLGKQRALPPVAFADPVVDEYFTTPVYDPYRWMEREAQSSAWASWIHGQTSFARSVLDALPPRAALTSRLRQLLLTTEVFQSVSCAENLIAVARQKGGETHSSIELFDQSGALASTSFDPIELAGTPQGQLASQMALSPDGRLLLFGIDESGRERPKLQIVDLKSRRLLTDHLDRVLIGDLPMLHWHSNGSGFFYCGFAEDRPLDAANIYEDTVVRFHRLGEKQAQDTLTLDRRHSALGSMAPTEWATVRVVPGVDRALLAIADGVARRFRLFDADLAAAISGAPDWRPLFPSYSAGIVDFAVACGDLYYITEAGRDRGQVHWKSLYESDGGHVQISESAQNLIAFGLSPMKSGVCVHALDNGCSRLFTVKRSTAASELGVPPGSGVYDVATAPSSDLAVFQVGDWTRPPALWLQKATSPARPLRARVTSAFESSKLTVERLIARAKDGTAIPIFVTLQRGVAGHSQRPCLLTAYGAYGAILQPQLEPTSLAFLNAGGILATAWVRGGGEFGERWHRGGYRETKPNSWRDLIACAQALIAQGYASPSTLAIWGRSAGAITVGRAFTERPDLFAAVVSEVGVNNPLRFEFGPNGSSNTTEFGSIKNRSGFHSLLAMDTYHHVESHKTYPPVLLTAGANDPRVPAWQVTKLAARLQSISYPGVTLLRVDQDSGHYGGAGLEAQVESLADLYSFVLWYAGAGKAMAARKRR